MSAPRIAPTVGDWRWPSLVSAVEGATPAEGEVVRLRAARCTICERTSFPARDACDWCGSATSLHSLPSDGFVVGHTEVLLDSPGSCVTAPYFVGFVRLGDLDVLGIAESPLRTGESVRTVAARLFDTPELHFAFRSSESGGS